MNRIFEKIYSEKDSNTNVALFVASIASLPVYWITKDITLVTISFIAFFSLTKVLGKIFSNILIRNAKKTALRGGFSNAEKDIIEAFIKKGTTFITISDYKKGAIGGDGLDSLVSRGVIEFMDFSLGPWPSGFKLDEDVYKSFLGK